MTCSVVRDAFVCERRDNIDLPYFRKRENVFRHMSVMNAVSDNAFDIDDILSSEILMKLGMMFLRFMTCI